jgi:hypothetical protein
MNMITRVDPAKKMASAALATCLMFGSGFASAAAVMGFTGGLMGGSADGGAGDISPLAGAVLVGGSLGEWDINIVAGVTKSALGTAQQSRMDLLSLNIATLGAADPLQIIFGENNFNTTGITHFASAIGGTLENADISWSACIDANNDFNFSCTDVFSGSASAAGTLITSFEDSDSFSVALDGPYSMYLSALITPNAGAPVSISFNYAITQVPIPAAAWLFGSAMVGLAGVARRRRA